MKKSTKPSILAGIILLIIASLFTFASLTQLIDLGPYSLSKANPIFITGKMLSSVYGYSSLIIPFFLFAAAICCFTKWTGRKALRLITAIIPFFTSVAIEKICEAIAENAADEFLTVKISLTALIGLMLIIIEILSAGVLADRIFPQEDDSEEEPETDEIQSESEESEIPSKVAQTSSSPLNFSSNTQDTQSEEKEETPAQEENTPKLRPDNPFAHVFDSMKSTTQPETKAQEESDDDEPIATGPLITQEEYAALAFTDDEYPTAGPFTLADLENQGVPVEIDTKKPETQSIYQQEEESQVSEEENDSENQEPQLREEVFSNSFNFLQHETPKTVSKTNTIDPYAANIVFKQPEQEQEEPEQDSNELPPDSDYDDFEDALRDFEEAEQDILEEQTYFYEEEYDDSDSQQQEIQEDSESAEEDEEINEPETSAYTENRLSPDFFDIDPTTEEQVEQESDYQEEDSEDTYIEENDDSGSIEQIEKSFAELENSISQEEAQEQPESEAETPVEETENQSSAPANSSPSRFDFGDSGFGIGQDVFADMAADAKDELESGVPYSPQASILADSYQEQEIQEESDAFAENYNEETSDYEEEITVPVSAVEGGINIQTAEPPARTTVKTEPKPEGHRVSPKKPYKVPTDLLEEYEDEQYWVIDDATKEDAEKLKDTLNQFDISAEVIGIKKGPVVTMFELLPAPGVRLSKIVGLQDNIALSLAASSVRIVAPIPGKAAVGIEVPNRKRSIVSFREMIEQDLPEWKKMAVPVILGKDILGKSQIIDIAKTPHLLIAGATGAGKSVCVNSLILSILYKRSPKDVKMILVDPKVVELKLYNDIPHLLTPVITEPKRALQALQYCLCEMERRYALLDQMGVRDISNYNKRIEERNICTEKLPYIVVIIDEFADLMATSGRDLESIVARLTAMSRAVGIHLVLATQRPSVNVITGLIKANIPSRIAFMVSSRTDSNIIIDSVGAEKLLGKGDMLYASAVEPYPVRIQGTFESDNDVENVVNYVKTLGEPEYIDDEIFVEDEEENDIGTGLFNDGSSDPLYQQALDIVIQSGKASASYLQRRLSIGYNRAARLIEEMEERGIVGPANGSKPREIIHVPS